MKGKPTYAGKIKNTGTQKVDAIFKPSGGKGAKIKEGGDLRCGKGK